MATEKVTLSLPRDLVRYADRKAMESGANRSQVIAEAVAERKAREEAVLAAEGYEFFSAEAEEFARRALPSFWEVIRDAA